MVWQEQGVTKGDVEGKEGLGTTPALSGSQAPDVKLVAPAMWTALWLQSVLENRAHFHVVLFLGMGDVGRKHFRTFKKGVEEKFVAAEKIANTDMNVTVSGYARGGKKRRKLPIRYVTVLPQIVDKMA